MTRARSATTDADTTTSTTTTTSTAAASAKSAAPSKPPARHHGRFPLPGRRRWWPLALAVLLMAVGAGLKSTESGGSSATTNQALSDQAATRTILGEIPPAVARIFSYSAANPAATSAAADAVLTGKALSQYRTLFAVVTREAPRQGITLTTTVNRAGIVRLDAPAGDRRDRGAVLLLFLDQTAARPGKRPTHAAAQLIVTVGRHDGRWRITDLRAA